MVVPHDQTPEESSPTDPRMTGQQSLPSRQDARTAPRINCGYTLIGLALPVVCICLFLAWLFGYIDDARMLIRSYSFPAILAQHKPVADQLAAITSDTLINRSQSIDNAVSATHLHSYTGGVSGVYKMTFATNRSFDDALGDYVRFLQSNPDWTINTRSYASARNSANTEEVSITLADKGVGDSTKYKTIYIVTLYFGDPALWLE